MAKILKTNGEVIENVQPNNGTDFCLRELQDIVNGHIEILWLHYDKLMVVNEDGKLLKLPVNHKATEIFLKEFFPRKDIIVGDVLICDKNQVSIIDILFS